MATGLEIAKQRETHVWRWGLLLLALIVLAGVGWFALRYYTTGLQPPIPIALATPNANVDEREVTPQEKQQHSVEASHPRYISIPSLDITRARVLQVGVAPSGELDTPPNIHDVGWYNKSVTPGSGSSALLLDGHNGGPTKGGVFERLEDLGVGDLISIERGDGEKFNYEVVENKTLPLKSLNNGGMKRMSESASDSQEGLNIISCTGNWIPAQNTFDQRVTIRAVSVQ